MAQSVPVIESSLTTPRVRKITADQPWEWLAAGWRNTWQTPLPSFFYGIVFVIMGYFLVLMVTEKFYLALALTTGFLLLGPFLAMGLYDLSRHLEKGEPVSLGHSMLAWRHNTMAILLFGIVVGLIMIVWIRLSGLIFGVVLEGATPTVESNTASLFFSGDGLIFLTVFTVIGAVLAGLVFTISVVSIPMLLDRKTDFITAVLTSITAVRTNPGPMILWAALIVIFTAVGLATFYLGLAITMPLIGHATWYAYRDLVEPEAPPASSAVSA
jgi:uncharacterized membrane protein